MDIQTIITRELHLAPTQVQAAIALFDEGNTLPFIARYRKEVTGSLDEEQLRQLSDRLTYLRLLIERKATVRESLVAQEKLTPELDAALESAETLQAVEDLYLPFRPKRRTRAMIARERGLEPLAQMILVQAITRDSLATLATPFLNDQVPDTDAAWAGARDIVAEIVSDDSDLRGSARNLARSRSEIISTQLDAALDPTKIFAQYYEFTMPLTRVRPHHILALNRGETIGALKVTVKMPELDILARLRHKYAPNPKSLLAEQMMLATQDANERLLLPAIERDMRRMLTEEASAHAIRVFADNVRALLLQPPIRNHAVIGIDPGFRTGCKIAVVDSTGKVITTGAIFPHEPQKQWSESKLVLKRLVEKTGADLFVIGNGTASRETEQLVAEVIAGGVRAEYLITSEQGASVYSASPLARAELPELDVTLRGAVSIARRVVDPLAELVKIDPRSIGVGLYQHDLDETQLSAALDAVVESVVNAVGVDVNTASPALLRYVAGIGPKLAEMIFAYREVGGAFPDRAALRKVKGLGPKSFEQAAGFMRVSGGAEPLDNTAIHPESYAIVRNLFELIGVQGTERDLAARVNEFRKHNPVAELAQVLNCGEPTLVDILDQLVRPGRDPRDELPKPLLRRDVLKIEDLKQGMRLSGTVRNVVDFGAFVDIGLKHDGLLHKSQMRRAQTAITVGAVIDVVILTIEAERERIGLGLPE